MKTFLALVKARNIEFYRDRGSLMWAFIFPLLIIIGCALAFAKPNPYLFKIGILNSSDTASLPSSLQKDYIETIPYDNLAKAQQRIQHHQLDLLYDTNKHTYWVNSESKNGIVLEQLVKAEQPNLASNTLTGKAVRYVDWVIPGVLGMNLMFGSLFGVGYVVVRYRQNGVLKRFKATPMSAVQFISAQIISRMLIVCLVNTIIFAGCYWLLDLLVLGSFLNLLLVLALGSIAMISLGLLMASRTANEELAGGLLNSLTWPMLFLSEIWFTLDNAPQWMQQLSQALPLTHIVTAARAIMIEGAQLQDISFQLIALSIFSVVCIAISAKLFVWHR